MPGTYSVEWLFDDGNDNSTVLHQTVIIRDTIAPTPVVAELNTLKGECGVRVTDVPKAIDNCGEVISATTQDPLYYEVQGVYNVLWTFTDKSGNTTRQWQRVKVTDNSAPEFDAPSDVTIQSAKAEGIGVTNVWDKCTPDPEVTYTLRGATNREGSGDASAATFAPGITTVTYYVKDRAGNISSASFKVNYQIANPQGPGEQNEPGNPMPIISGLGSQLEQGFQVYPNPTQNRVFVELGTYTDLVQISLHGATGQLIDVPQQAKETGIQLDLSQLPQGTYFIRMQAGSQYRLHPVIRQ